MDSGNDWQTVRGDGAITLDVRLVLKTDDNAMIGMIYRGIRHGPPEVMARIDRGEAVDPTSYYFRISASFRDIRYEIRLAQSSVGGRSRASHGRWADLQPIRAPLIYVAARLRRRLVLAQI
jgi:Protein of unknown function (DUF3237)